MSQVVQCITVYEQNTMKQPPGDGCGGVANLVKVLREPGRKESAHPWMSATISLALGRREGDSLLLTCSLVAGPRWAPIHIIHYRNNRGRRPGPMAWDVRASRRAVPTTSGPRVWITNDAAAPYSRLDPATSLDGRLER
jgi:hypothetical protein